MPHRLEDDESGVDPVVEHAAMEPRRSAQEDVPRPRDEQGRRRAAEITVHRRDEGIRDVVIPRVDRDEVGPFGAERREIRDRGRHW